MGTVDDNGLGVLLLCLQRDDVSGNAIASRLERAGVPKVSLLRADAMANALGNAAAIIILWTKRSIPDAGFRAAASLAASAGKAVHVAYADFADNEVWSGPVVKRGDDDALLAAINRLLGETTPAGKAKPASAPLSKPAASQRGPSSGPATLDVFLSYRSTQKDFARELATFLSERGFNVWWDAALLAGQNFAQIVHEEVRRARAVVVLWSRAAIASPWVMTEASIAKTRKTLINTIIDDLGVEEIPEEYRSIQAVRMEEGHQHAFFEAIAEAIRAKGTDPSHASRNALEAREDVDRRGADALFFSGIGQSDDAAEYRLYLDKFGPDAQFAELARGRIARLEKKIAEERRIAPKVTRAVNFWLGLAAAAATLVTAAIVIWPMVFPQPQPVDGPVSTAATIAPAPASMALQPGEAILELQGGGIVRGTVRWDEASSLGIGNDKYVAHVQLSDAPYSADVTFRPPDASAGDVGIEVSMNGIASLTQVEADGVPVAAAGASVGLASPGSAGSTLVGGTTNLEPLTKAGGIGIGIELAGGLRGVLRLTGPTDTDAFLRFLVYPYTTLVMVDPPGGGGQA